MRSRPRESGEPAIVSVRVKPGASQTRVGGRHEGAHGTSLILAVRERAVDGKATEAARRALAEALGVPQRDVSLRSGTKTRDKLFVVERPPSDLDARLARLLGSGEP